MKATRLVYTPPLPWEELLAFLAPRAVRGVENITTESYRRAVRLGDVTGWLEVRAADDHTPSLFLRTSPSLVPHLKIVVARLRLLFDLDVDPAAVANHLRTDPLLRPLVEKRPGLRVPGAFDPFEMAVRAVLGQQVSVKGATTLCGRVVERFGRRSSIDDLPFLFPSASELAGIDVATMRTIGLPESRARTIVELARAVADGRADLSGAGAPETAIASLVELPGIGPWTAHYLAMRGFHWADAFPAADLGVMKALGLTKPRGIEARAEAWRPWRSYAVMLLWASLSASQ